MLYYIVLCYITLHYIVLYLCNVSVLFILHGKLFEINLPTYLSTWQIAYILISCLSRPFQLLIFIGCVYVIHTEMCGRKYNLQVLYRTLPLESTCFTETVDVVRARKKHTCGRFESQIGYHSGVETGVFPEK